MNWADKKMDFRFFVCSASTSMRPAMAIEIILKAGCLRGSSINVIKFS